MGQKDKTTFYILVIVGVVALLGMSTFFTGFSKEDFSGHATSAIKTKSISKICSDGACVTIDTDGDGTDTDGDGLSDNIETTVGLDPMTDDLSSYKLLEMDDPVMSGTKVTDGSFVGDQIGSVVQAYDSSYRELGYYLDLTSSTTEDYVNYTGYTYDFSGADWFVIKTLVKPSTTDITKYHSIVTLPTSTCYYPQYTISASNGEYKTRINIAGTMKSVSSGRVAVTADTWQEIVAVYKDSTLYLFVDGIEVGTHVTTSGSLVSSSRNLYLGLSDPSCSYNYDFEGYMDTAYIWGE